MAATNALLTARYPARPLDALALVGSRSEASTVPEAPLEAIAPRFRDWVLDDRGRPIRARYELALMFAFKDALRAGTVWRSRSRRHADPATPDAARAMAAGARGDLDHGRPAALDPQVRLEQLQADQENAARALQHAIDQHAGVRIETGKVIAEPVEALRLPPEVAWLDDRIDQEGCTGSPPNPQLATRSLRRSRTGI